MQKQKTIMVRLDDLRERCVDALEARGCPDDVAHIVFDDYLEAEARGRASHGFVSFDVALGAFPTRGTAEILDHRASLLTIDGHGDCGHRVARMGIDTAFPHLSQAGVYLVGIRDITRFNTPGPIARYGAERGLVTLVFEYGGANFIAPPGATQAALSTNPIGIAVPGTDPIFLLDIAVSDRAWGYITLAKLSGEQVSESMGLTASGETTSDPAHVAMLRPFGGYKGFGLGLAAEILSGALVGAPIGKQGSLASRGALIILMRPDAFGVTTDAFTKNVRSFLTDVISTPTVDGSHIRYPGETSTYRYNKILHDGEIELPQHIWDKLKKDTDLEI